MSNTTRNTTRYLTGNPTRFVVAFLVLVGMLVGLERPISSSDLPLPAGDSPVIGDILSTALGGTVNIDNGEIVDVLFVNGSSYADQNREVTLSVGEVITIDIDSPPSRVGALSPHAIFAYIGRVDETTATAWPWRLGIASFPGHFMGGGPDQARTLTNSWGPSKYDQLGIPMIRGFIHAPTQIVSTTLSQPFVVTLQGVIRDETTGRPKGGITNGVIVTVE